MAQQVEDVKVLNIDGTPYAVDAMSDEVQAMVDVFNGWNQKEADVRDELAMIQAAKNDISRRIILQVRQEKEEAEGAVEEGTPAGDTEAASTAAWMVLNTFGPVGALKLLSATQTV